MASVLGFDSDLPIVREADRDYRAAMADSIKAIGAQVSGFIKERQTQKQLQAMGQELRTLDLTSDSFPLEAMGVAQKYPLATQSKVGQQTFDLLGLAWKQQKSAANMRIRGTYQDEQGNIYRQYANGEFDIPPPQGARISRLGSFEGERVDLARDREERIANLEAEKFELSKDKETRIANEAKQKARLAAQRTALQNLNAARSADSTIAQAQARKMTQLGKDKDLKTSVWQEDGQWYKVTPEDLAEYKKDQIAGEFKVERRTKITEEEARQIEAKKKEFVDLPVQIDQTIGNMEQTRQQLNVLMGQMGDISPDQTMPDDDLPSQMGDVPVLKSKREFDALPSGSIYIRDGKRYRKP